MHAGPVEKLNERFAASKGAPLELDGETVFGWWVPEAVPVEVLIRFESRQGDRRQGVALTCDEGQLEVKVGRRRSFLPSWRSGPTPHSGSIQKALKFSCRADGPQ